MKHIKLFIILILIIVFWVSSSGCKVVPIYAGEGAIIVISSDKNSLGTGGERAIITVMGFNSDGTPLHDRIKVLFSASLGTIEPTEVEINSGKATVEFRSGSSSGVAEIIARSGNIIAEPNPLKIIIGSAGLGALSISANPTSFKNGGGRSHIMAIATDSDGNPLPNIRVVLTSTSGTFENPSTFYTTDTQGMIEDYIQVTETTRVKAEAGSKSAEVEIQVDETTNQNPTANFVYSPSPPRKGDTVHFNAGLSTDSDGTIVEYRWDFGDGKTGTGVTPDHIFTWIGTASSMDFTVVLTVVDDKGGTDVTSQKISVQGQDENKLPTAQFSISPESPIRGEAVHFNGSLSTDTDGYIVSWQWDFGDGSSGSREKMDHTYNWTGETAQTYTVILTVTDDKGGKATTTKSIKIDVDENQLPVANFTYEPASPKKNESVTFDATSSTDPDGAIVSYSWNFGDSSTGSGSIINHAFTWTEAGSKTFSVILTVKDSRGGENSKVVKITVTE